MRKKLKEMLFHIIMLCAAFLTVMPFLWMLSASLMFNGESTVFPPKFFPDKITFSQYAYLLNKLNLGRYFLNSFILAAGVTLVSLIVNSMAGFVFAKYVFKGKKQIFTLLLATMIIPGQVTMLPVFIMLQNLGLLNSYFGIILPAMASVFGIFLFRQYLSSIPDALIEAAKIDGAGDWLIYRKIIIPLSKPILVTLALFTFMGTWNDFFWPLIVMSKNEMYTLPVALANLLGENVQDTEMMMAGSVITVLPVILLFLFLQKYYLRGILLGGTKE